MKRNKIEWESRGKTIEGLIRELNSFEDKTLKVELSLDGGITSNPISLVSKVNGLCLLISIKPKNDL